MQQSRHHRLVAELHLEHDASDSDRVRDVGFAGLPGLPGMRIPRQRIGPADIADLFGAEAGFQLLQQRGIGGRFGAIVGPRDRCGCCGFGNGTDGVAGDRAAGTADGRR